MHCENDVKRAKVKREWKTKDIYESKSSCHSAGAKISMDRGKGMGIEWRRGKGICSKDCRVV